MKFSIIVVSLSLGLLLSTKPLWADFAATNDGANGIDPLDISKGQESNIRMEKEHLDFSFNKKNTKVTATFWFKNTDTTSAVTQMSGFPDEALGAGPKEDKQEYMWDRGVMGALEDLEVLVDGKAVSAPVSFGYVDKTKDGYWVPSNPKDGEKVGWYMIRLVIPPDGEKVVELHYKTQNGNFEESPPFFTYILHTGATWKGTIGELTADLHLEDGLTSDNLYWPRFPEELAYGDSMEPGREEWKQVDDHHLQLTLRDFKPKDRKSLTRIKITVTDPGKMTEHQTVDVDKRNKYFVGKGYEIVYAEWEGDVPCFFSLQVDSKMVSKATGGLHLSEYVKPGDQIEYAGTWYYGCSVKINDPNKDFFKILKKK